MKTAYWDDPDPRMVWDNPNLRWGDPSYLLEPGDEGYVELQPGDPGYVPPAPKPEPPPKRRRPRLSQQDLAKLNINPTSTPTHMDNKFHFNVVPLPGGQSNTTRVVLQDELATAELVAKAKVALEARELPLTEAQITACGEELAKIVIAEGLAKGRPVRRAFGYLTWEPASGGKHIDPDFNPTVENMNATGNGRLAPQGQMLFDSVVEFQRDGVLGAKLPVISRVYDGVARECECITLGGPFRLTSQGAFGPEIDPANTALGIFLSRTGGTPVRLVHFSEWTESEIFGSWPAAITGTGNVTLKIVVLYRNNANPSTFTYQTLLPIMP